LRTSRAVGIVKRGKPVGRSSSLRDYELVYIVDPLVSDEDVPGVTDRVTRWISGRGGEIANINPWGRRRLAYPIGERREGNYIAVQFKIAPATTSELERTLELAEDILRHLLIRLD
jgi:small subunit ribosomal protein S6